MRRVAVVIAAVVVLAGCGSDSSGTSAEPAGSSSPSTDATAEPTDEPTKKPADKPTKKPREDKPAAAPTVPPGTPACAAVWTDGTMLARDYTGCRVGKRFVEPDDEPCSFGKRLVRYGDRFYAVRGGPVNRTDAPLAKDRDYRGAIASCRA